ncbi:MAG: YicC family protein [Clostridia bacterium]|nr:YicC family protein [Clostridia bacterium]
MTGFGHGYREENGWSVTIDLKSVNHRFLDLSLRLPKEQLFLEEMLRKSIAESISRGHVEVYVTILSSNGGGMDVIVDQGLAEKLYGAAEEIGRLLKTDQDVTVSRIMGMEGVLQLVPHSLDQDLIGRLCRGAVEEALGQILHMREIEGAALRKDLEGQLEGCEQIRDALAARAPKVTEEFGQKLQARLARVNIEPVEPQRLAQEIAILADKLSVDEELARLESHFRQMRSYLDVRGEIGKKMDFLIQEMNREANTTGSKCSDAEMSRMVVELKSRIEKMREQVQNVE